jgi:hypothetical protein
MSAPLTHLTWDIETLGMKETTVVTTLAIIPFTFEGNETYDELVLNGFYVKFSIADQLKNWKRTTTQSTIDWWKTQSEEAKVNSIKPSKDDVALEAGLDQIEYWIGKSKYDMKKSYNWARGSNFDFPKIEDMFDMAGRALPFNTWKIRDTRTYIDVLTGNDRGAYELKNGTPKNFIHHHALHDAALDTMRLKEIYATLSE